MNPLTNSICPICGGKNHCVAAQSGNFLTPCWCAAQKIEPGALAKIPLGQRNKACICQSCAGLPRNEVQNKSSQENKI